MNERLKLISGHEPLVLEPSDGRETIAQATGVFSYIDSNFKHWGCDVPGPPTEETSPPEPFLDDQRARSR